MKKKEAELGHSDLLPVYESHFAKMPIYHKRITQQIIVGFNQYYLQIESFQIHATGRSKMAGSCYYQK